MLPPVICARSRKLRIPCPGEGAGRIGLGHADTVIPDCQSNVGDSFDRPRDTRAAFECCGIVQQFLGAGKIVVTGGQECQLGGRDIGMNIELRVGFRKFPAEPSDAEATPRSSRTEASGPSRWT